MFEFLTLGGVFLGVKNNSKNFLFSETFGLFSKILSNGTLFDSKSAYFLEVLRFSQFQAIKNHQKNHNF